FRLAALPGGTGEVGGDDVGCVPVQAAAGPVVPHRGPRVRVRGRLLPIPERRAIWRTTRPAPCRSSRRPSFARNTGPSVRSPMARSIARAVRGASGTVTTLPPLRVTVRVRWPRSRPRCSMSALVASDTRSPFSASSEISACTGGDPRTADVGGRRAVQELFFDGVLVEPGDGGQPPRDGGPGPAHRFQVPGKAFD